MEVLVEPGGPPLNLQSTQIHLGTHAVLLMVSTHRYQKRHNAMQCLTNERPARNMLRLKTACLDEIGGYPEVLKRSYVRVCIGVVAERILAGQCAVREGL